MAMDENTASEDAASLKVILGYWNLRGGCRGNPARYMLHYAGVPFEEKTYVLGEPEWARDK
jgi:glutathione S-transferase